MKNDLEKAEFFWTQLTRADQLDRDFFEIPKEGWLRFCREAQQMSQAALAERLGISQQAVVKLEKNEVAGAISLERLKSVAEKMDCEVVYFVRHKQKKTFARLLWRKILPTAIQEYKTRLRTQELKKPMVLAKIAEGLFRNPQFRQKMNWAQNSKEDSAQ